MKEADEETLKEWEGEIISVFIMEMERHSVYLGMPMERILNYIYRYLSKGETPESSEGKKVIEAFNQRVEYYVSPRLLPFSETIIAVPFSEAQTKEVIKEFLNQSLKKLDQGIVIEHN